MKLSLFALGSVVLLLPLYASAAGVNIRINQAGYLPTDSKVAIAFSREALSGTFELKAADSGRTLLTGLVLITRW